MAQYFLVLNECGDVADNGDPIDFVDLEAAKIGAIAAAREIMSEEVKAGRLCLSWHISIEDADHIELARVPFREALLVTGL